MGVASKFIFLGAVYLHECHIEKMVPIFLMVNALLLIPILPGGLRCSCSDGEVRFSMVTSGGLFCGIITLLVNIGWLIAGMLLF